MTSQTSQSLMRRISKASKLGRTSLVEGSRKNILVASFGCRTLSLPSKSSNKSETNLDSLYLQFTKNYGTRSSRIFSSEHAANQFVRWLLPDERSALLAALKEYQSENEEVGTDKFQPSMKQLKMVAISNAIPFIGFGFLDNAIMILAGEYIDHTIGLTLGISTMAAAAVGNLISDIMGLGSQKIGFLNFLAAVVTVTSSSILLQRCIAAAGLISYPVLVPRSDDSRSHDNLYSIQQREFLSEYWKQLKSEGFCKFISATRLGLYVVGSLAITFGRIFAGPGLYLLTNIYRLAGYVEAIAIKLGFDVPPMSTRQASMWKTKYTAYLGRGVGIMIGCIIGMFPLLLIDATEEEEEEHAKEKSTIHEFEDDITNESRKRHVANGDVVQKKV